MNVKQTAISSILSRVMKKHMMCELSKSENIEVVDDMNRYIAVNRNGMSGMK